MKLQNTMSNLLSQVFAPVDGVVWDLMSNTTGVQCDDGIYTLADDGSIELSPLDTMSMAVPAFSQLMPTDQVTRVDVLMSGSKPSGWITGVKESKNKPVSLKALSFQGHETTFRPKAIKMFGMNGVTVVRSPLNFNMAPGGEQTSGFNMASMLPLLLLDNKDGSGIDTKTLALMSMMSGSGGGGGSDGMAGMNPMMLALLVGRDGGFQNR